MIGTATRDPQSSQMQRDSTFEIHYSIGDLAKQWRLGRETVRLQVKDEPGVLKIRMGKRKTMTLKPSAITPVPDMTKTVVT